MGRLAASLTATSRGAGILLRCRRQGGRIVGILALILVILVIYIVN